MAQGPRRVKGDPGGDKIASLPFLYIRQRPVNESAKDVDDVESFLLLSRNIVRISNKVPNKISVFSLPSFTTWPLMHRNRRALYGYVYSMIRPAAVLYAGERTIGGINLLPTHLHDESTAMPAKGLTKETHFFCSSTVHSSFLSF